MAKATFTDHNSQICFTLLAFWRWILGGRPNLGNGFAHLLIVRGVWWRPRRPLPPPSPLESGSSGGFRCCLQSRSVSWGSSPSSSSESPLESPPSPPSSSGSPPGWSGRPGGWCWRPREPGGPGSSGGLPPLDSWTWNSSWTCWCSRLGLQCRIWSFRAHLSSYCTHTRYSLNCCWWSFGSQSSPHWYNHCAIALVLTLEVQVACWCSKWKSWRMECWDCLCMSHRCHCSQCLLLHRSCIRLGRSPCKHWCTLLRSAFSVLKSLV